MVTTAAITAYGPAACRPASNPPTAPSIVLFGEMAGASRWRPSSRPVAYAPVSVAKVIAIGA